MAMRNCQEIEPILAAYADGGAPADARPAVDAHLERCPTCRERVASQRVAHEAVEACRDRLRPCAPAWLRARCEAQRRQASAPARRRRTWVPLSLAATLVLAIAGAVGVGLNDNVQAVTAQLALDHARCFQFAPERLGHGNAADVERQWASRQGWPIRVPPGSDSRQLELLGVRRCVTASGSTAHLLYRWRGEPLSVFVLPRALRRRGQADEIVNTFGHEAFVWGAGDRTYVALAHGRPADLPAVAAYLQASVR